MRSFKFALMFGLIHLCAACSQRAPEPIAKNEEPDSVEVLGDKRTAEREKKRLHFAAIEEKAIPVLKKLPRDEFDPKSALAVLSDDRTEVSDPMLMRSRGHTIARYYSDRDNWIRVWNVASGQMTYKIPAERWAIFDISPDGKSIAWFPRHGSKLYVTELKSNLCRSISTRCGQLTSLDYSPDGKTIAVSGVNASWTRAKIEIWNAKSRSLIHTISVPSNTTRVQFSPNGRLLGARNFYSVTLFDTSKWDQFKAIKTRYEVDEFAFSPDGWSVAMSGFKNGHQLELLDMATDTKEKLPALEKWAGPNLFGGGIAFDPTERYLAYSNLFEFAVWDRTNKRLVVRVNSETAGALPSRDFQFSPGGCFLFSAANRIYIWDVEELLKKYAIKN